MNIIKLKYMKGFNSGRIDNMDGHNCLCPFTMDDLFADAESRRR